MRKFFKCFLLGLIFLFTISLNKCVKANSINSISMDIYIDKNGDANITETWNCYSDSGTEVYHPYYNLGNSQIINLSVKEGSDYYSTISNWDTSADFSDKAYKCGINYIDNGVELCWGISDYGSHTYTVNYTITNFVSTLSDAQMVYWTLIPHDFSNRIDKTYIKIYADFDIPDTVDVWGYGNYGGTAYVYDGYIEMQSDGPLEKYEYMTILVKFPLGSFDSTNIIDNDFEYYYDMSKEGSTAYDSSSNNYSTNFFKDVFLPIFLICFFVIIFIITSIFKGCSKEDALASVPTGTVGTTASHDETAKSSTANKADELSPTYFMTPSIKDDNKNGTLSYSIYVWNKTGYELFSSDDARAQNYAQTINGFADKFGSSVKVYDMIVPNHTEMGLPQRLKDSDAPSTSQADNIKAAYAALSDKVTPINCYNRLAEHNTDYIYFKSDHHWTGLGAYYAYTAFADTNDLPVLSLDDCEEQKIDGFTGSFTNSADGLDSDTVSYWKFPYNVTMDITQADGSSASYDSPYYEAAEGGSNTYGVFIMGDNALTVLKSASKNAAAGKKIAVVKESYGNAFVPYLTNNYEEVHVIDFRYFKQNLVDYCKTNGIDEVLFMNGVMSANTQVQLDSMSGLFN